MGIIFIDEVGFAKDVKILDREKQIFKDYLGDPLSMCERIAQLEAERDRLREVGFAYRDRMRAQIDKVKVLEAENERMRDALQSIYDYCEEETNGYIKDIAQQALKEQT